MLASILAIHSTFVWSDFTGGLPDRLPAEHQASMALLLVSKLADGEYGGWLLSSIALLNSQGSLPVAVSNEHLKQVGLTDEELSQLTEADHQNIRQRIVNHWLQDGFWEELDYQAKQVLEEKNPDASV